MIHKTYRQISTLSILDQLLSIAKASNHRMTRLLRSENPESKIFRTRKREIFGGERSLSTKKIKLEEEEYGVREEKFKDEEKQDVKADAKEISVAATTGKITSKKLASQIQFSQKTPFPDFSRPTAAECKMAHRILSSLHGARIRPQRVIAPKSRAGCGDSPSVLDALVRTILSQNTNDQNSTRAKHNMDKVYGRSDKWEAIVAGGQKKLQETIQSGGLSRVKSQVILSILNQVYDRYGVYSLDHLHGVSNDEAMHEMLSFKGVGPKTASCVLLFSLQRESFAVDTHVWRITGLLGWRPVNAGRDETFRHLDARIPDEDKYGLHILLITHGKNCPECRAGGKNVGICELRKAFSLKIQDEDLKTEDIKKEIP